MSQNLRNFTQAVFAFDAVVQRMPSDKWDAPTPCEEWNAKELVEHQCAVLNGVATIAQTGQMARPTPSPESDDPVATWTVCRENVLSSLDRHGVLSQVGPFWFGAADVDGLVAAVQWDPMTHAWDLAQAGGIDHGLDEGLVQSTMSIVEPQIGMLSETGRTQPSIGAADDSSPLNRYLALVGRTA